MVAERKSFLAVSALTAFATAILASTSCHYDWSLLPDAGADAGAGGGASSASGSGGSAPFTCDGALFCHSFDDGKLKPVWDSTPVSDGGTLLIDDAGDAPTPPGTLLAMRPAQMTQPSSAEVRKTIGGDPFTRASLAFEIHPDQLDPDRHVCVGGILFDTGEPYIRLLLGAGSPRLEERIGGMTYPYPIEGGPPDGEWSHVVLSVDIAGKIKVEVRGVEVVETDTHPGWQPSAALLVFVGINYLDTPSGAVTLHYDNVRVDGS